MDHDQENVAVLREMLLDRSATKALATSLAQNYALQSSANHDRRDEFAAVLFNLINTSQQRNVDVVFENAQSEIELLFLNQLVLVMSLKAPLLFHVLSPAHDALESIANMRNDYDEARCCLEHYFSHSRDFGHASYKDAFNGLVALLDKCIAEGGVGEDFKNTCLGVECMDLPNSIFAIMQAGFPRIKVKGHSIRTDLLAFVPSLPTFRVVVECDGFEYHARHDRFVSDRIRDRLLKSEGLEVLRYSGSEIYANPLDAANDLATYLLDRKPPHSIEPSLRWAARQQSCDAEPDDSALRVFNPENN